MPLYWTADDGFVGPSGRSAPMRSSLLVLCFAILVPVAGRAQACSVPVFRYALERWPADAYLVYLFHAGQLPPADEASAARLANAAQAAGMPTNVWFERCDTDKPLSETPAAIWQRHRDRTDGRPWLVVRYPAHTMLEEDAWAGPLSAEAVEQLLQSPVRTELARRLLDGESVVWLLLDSGDARRDAAIENQLREELAILAEDLKLPEILEADLSYMTASGPQLRVAFSLLRVARDDPREALFRQVLLASIPPEIATGQALVVPVFGRARALTFVPADRLGEGAVEEIAYFLTGQCSCQVKDMNPGVDLLVSADWEGVLAGVVPLSEGLPELVNPSTIVAASQPVLEAAPAGAEPEGIGTDDALSPPTSGVAPAAAAPVERRAPPAASQGDPPGGSRAVFWNVAMVLGVGIGLVALASLILLRRRVP